MPLPLTSILIALSFTVAIAAPGPAKQRVIVLTDIENEPDDTQSMVRFLVYSNHWDVEALIATTSINAKRPPPAASGSSSLPTERSAPIWRCTSRGSPRRSTCTPSSATDARASA